MNIPLWQARRTKAKTTPLFRQNNGVESANQRRCFWCTEEWRYSPVASSAAFLQVFCQQDHLSGGQGERNVTPFHLELLELLSALCVDDPSLGAPRQFRAGRQGPCAFAVALLGECHNSPVAQPDGGDEDVAEFNYDGRKDDIINDGTGNDAPCRQNTSLFICEWEYDWINN